LDPDERKTGLFRIAASPLPEGEDDLPNVTLLVEGVEKVLAALERFEIPAVK